MAPYICMGCWPAVATADWVAALLGWEEQERGGRSPE
jgi:hypothetical protein